MSQELRRRGPKKTQEESDTSTVVAKLKKLDIYSKVHDDYTVQTDSGGCVSILSVIMMIFLFVNELQTYLTVDVVDRIVVDRALDQKLPISLNLTLPHLRCDEVSVNTVDSTGENHVDVHGSLVQIELNADGQVAQAREVKPDECLSCLEAVSEENKCCNSCQDLKDAYTAKNLPYFHVMDTAEQCRDSVGCRVSGDVLVKKASGNLHIALGHSVLRDGKQVHEFNIKDVSDGFNTSHLIHKVRFGNTVPGVASPLEGTSRIVRAGAGMFHYYVKLVPTLFVGRDGDVYTNQYAVTDSAKNVMVRKGELTGLPGIFMVYEFSPFMVEKIENIVPFSHFLTQVCAIIGGVFTTAGLVDNMMYRSLRKLVVHKK